MNRALAEFSRLPCEQYMARTFFAREADARDAHLFNVYARMAVKPHARRMILSGLAAFNRNVQARDSL